MDSNFERNDSQVVAGGFKLKDLETCPYDESHKVISKRMDKHLKKCHKDAESYISCRFNGYHKLPEDKINEHEENCPDRLKMEIFMIDYYNNFSENIKINEKTEEMENDETSEDENYVECEDQEQQQQQEQIGNKDSEKAMKIPIGDIVMHYGLLLLITVVVSWFLWINYEA